MSCNKVKRGESTSRQAVVVVWEQMVAEMWEMLSNNEEDKGVHIEVQELSIIGVINGLRTLLKL